MSIRIVSVETYLPERVRAQSDWPATTVKAWRERLGGIVPRNEAAVQHVTEGVRLSLDAIRAIQEDPFQGVDTVRVISDDMEPSDLEVRAASLALERAQLAATDVDMLMSHGMVPDVMCVNPGSIVHHKLGMRRDAPAFGVDAVCMSFVMQLDLARKAIVAGDAQHVLLTQSSACTRIMPDDEPFAPWFGDAGGAAVVAEAPPGYGLLGTTFRTDGSLSRAFCASVPDQRWHGSGRVVACSQDRASARRMQLQAADVGRELIADALAQAGVRHEDVTFFACHQPAVWFPEVCRRHAGLTNAKMLSTYGWTGNLSNVNIPMQLAVATREHLLKRGDVVAFFSIASGMMAVASVMRWS